MGYVLLGLLAFVLYRFIFRFVIPVYRATKQVKKKFREFEEMKQQQNGQPRQDFNTTPPPKNDRNNNRDKDYIDFEEVGMHHEEVKS